MSLKGYQDCVKLLKRIIQWPNISERNLESLLFSLFRLIPRRLSYHIQGLIKDFAKTFTICICVILSPGAWGKEDGKSGCSGFSLVFGNKCRKMILHREEKARIQISRADFSLCPGPQALKLDSPLGFQKPRCLILKSCFVLEEWSYMW